MSRPKNPSLPLAGITLSFPNVGKMPAPPAPFVPAPFPDLSSDPGRQAASGRVNQAMLASAQGRMASLHQQMQSLGSNATAQQWQDLLEQYITAATEIFRLQRGD